MKKNNPKLFLILTLIFLSGTFVFAQEPKQEAITITTYYPAPYGVYKQMKVSDRLQIVGQDSPPANPQVGDIYFDTSISPGKFYYYGPDNQWHDLVSLPRFPRPDFDSGWFRFWPRPDSRLDSDVPNNRWVLNFANFDPDHTLGSNRDRYFVDIKYRGPNRGGMGPMGLNQGGLEERGADGDIEGASDWGRVPGRGTRFDTIWRNLENDSISIDRVNLEIGPSEVRIRIWDTSRWGTE